MKELSIEEKAKAYDEAVEKLRSLRDNYDTVSTLIDIKEELENIFPELAESKDERIINSIICALKHYYIANTVFDGFSREDMIAWLEKQGDLKREVNYPKFDFNDILALQCCMETVKKVQEDKELYEKLNDLHSRVYDAYQLEKQGEQKDVNEDAEKEKYDYVSGQFLYCKGSFNEFKEGESYWLEYIGNDTYVGRSDNILNQKFHITPRQLYTWLDPRHPEDSNKCEQKPADKVEPKFKVGQTIKKEDFNPRFPIVKIEDGFYYNDMGDHFPFTDQDNWKLVEQNSAWSVEDEDILNTIINHFKIDIECTDEDDMVRWLKSLKDRVQPKQEWSEEDETTRKALINLVEMYYGGCIDKTEKNRLLNFLKSLRPQNWTKEDKERYINCLQRLGTGDPKQPETINSKWFKEHVYPQPIWKPSEEQIEALDDFIYAKYPNIEKYGAVVKSLYQDLKKLREELL